MISEKELEEFIQATDLPDEHFIDVIEFRHVLILNTEASIANLQVNGKLVVPVILTEEKVT